MHKPSLEKRPGLAFQKPAINKKLFLKYIKSERKPIDNYHDKEIVIAIVAYNERELLIRLVEKLLGLNDSRAGILVVDNGLDKDIKKILNEYPLYYIETTSNIGCTGGRNLAAACTNAPLLAFLDADGDINDNYIEECIKSMISDTTICARGKVLPLTKNSKMPSHYDLGNSIFPYYTSAEGISVWRTNDYKKAGGFEIDLYGGEGVVLNYRMISLMGYKKEQFIYYPRLILYHDYNNNITHLESKEMRNLINRWSIDRKYPLLDSLIVEFNNSSTNFRPTISYKATAKTDELIQKTRTKFNSDLEAIYNNNFENRWKKADRVKKGHKFKFAVIIPCYNLGHMIEDAVKSIMRQTIDSVQIIVVDDASPDPDGTTMPMLKSLEAHVEVVYRKKNGGASAARNTGIKVANADYILCLDSDDTIMPTYLEEAYNIFEMDKSIGVVAPYARLKGERIGIWRTKDNVGIPEALLSSPIPNASCYRKEAWKEIEGYDEDMRGYEDWEFWISILEKGWQIRVIPRPHYIYFNRPGSKVKTSHKNASDIVGYIVRKHEATYEQYMAYTISSIYKKYIDTQAKVSRLESQIKKRKSDQISIILHKVARKAKTARQILFTEKDYREAGRRINDNFVKVHRKLKQ